MACIAATSPIVSGRLIRFFDFFRSADGSKTATIESFDRDA